MKEKQKYRTITFYKDYFQTFFDKQNKKVKSKIVWTFDLVEELERVPETYLKHLEKFVLQTNPDWVALKN